MVALVIGGAGSGKSEYAESLVCSLPGERIYLATMEPFGREAQERILRHRKNRNQKGFQTVERYVDLAGLRLPPDCNLLLECMGNLTANELFRPDGGGREAVIRDLESLWERCGNLTIVSNEVFSGGADYQGDTMRYLKELAWINRWIAVRADRVIELCCGLPSVWKGNML